MIAALPPRSLDWSPEDDRAIFRDGVFAQQVAQNVRPLGVEGILAADVDWFVFSVGRFGPAYARGPFAHRLSPASQRMFAPALASGSTSPNAVIRRRRQPRAKE